MPVKNSPTETAKPEAPKVEFSETKETPPVAPTPPADDVSREEVAPTEISKPDRPAKVEEEDDKPQSYVWLANGTVKRCYNEDLPQNGGLDLGHWDEGSSVHQIVFVFPVEETVKGR